jgi:hypothetical protein
MEPETITTPSVTTETPAVESKTIERGSFLKGAAAVAATVAGAGVASTVARAARVEFPTGNAAVSGECLVWCNGNQFSAAQVAAFNKVYPNVKVTQKTTTYVPATPSLAAHLVTGVDVPDGIFFIEDAYLGKFAPTLYDVTAQVAP